MKNSEGALRVLAIGTLPPPITGVGLAFAMASKGLSAHEMQVSVVDIGEHAGRPTGAFTWRRAVDIARRLLVAAWRMRTADAVYVTTAQTRVGVARDAMVVAAAALWRVPVVAHHHGGNFRAFYDAQPPVVRCAVRTLVDRYAKIVVLGESLRSEFAMGTLAPLNTVVVPNACSVPLLRPRRAPTGCVRLLYLSNMMVEKGYRDVLDAAPMIAAQLPQFRVKVDFAGKFISSDDGRDSAELEREFCARARSLKSTVEVTWHGVVEGRVKESLLAESDVFLLPTYYSQEGQPISVLEAVTSALPVIATAYRGIPEVLPPDMQPFSVPPQSPAAIVDAVVRLIGSDPATYERISKAAREWAVRYAPEAHVARIARVIRAAARRQADPMGR